MNIFAIVLSSLLLLACPQLLTYPSKNNLQSQQQQPASSQADQAAQFIYSHYPQLANFSLVSATAVGRKVNETSKATSLLVVLGDNQTIQAFVIVAFFQDGLILEASPLLLQLQPSNTPATQVLPSNTSSGRRIAYLQTGNELVFLPSEAIALTRTFPINSIPIAVSRLSDPRLALALALVLASHPQITHYAAESVAYQIVSGINYFIRYRGQDETTQVRAWVFVDLDMKASLIELEVGCLEGGLASFNCSNDLAERLFKAGESLMLIYPQLMNSNVLSVVSDDIVPDDGMLLILTYESLDKTTRTMVELNLLASGFNLQSYYLYSSPRS